MTYISGENLVFARVVYSVVLRLQGIPTGVCAVAPIGLKLMN